MEKIKECPICGQTFVGMGAISRKDNKTEICSDFGVMEALAEWENYKKEKAND